jgi:hypothetical protein
MFIRTDDDPHPAHHSLAQGHVADHEQMYEEVKAAQHPQRRLNIALKE